MEVKDIQSCTLIIRFTKRNCKAKCESLIPVTNYRSLLLKSVYSQSVVHGLEVQHPNLNHFASLGFVNLLFKNESNVKIHVFHGKSNISTKTKNTYCEINISLKFFIVYFSIFFQSSSILK